MTSISGRACAARYRGKCDAGPRPDAPAPPHFALPTRPVLLIGLVGLCAVFGEQAGTDWSAFYIRNELGGSASVAALAVSAFAVAMATEPQRHQEHKERKRDSKMSPGDPGSPFPTADLV